MEPLARTNEDARCIHARQASRAPALPATPPQRRLVVVSQQVGWPDAPCVDEPTRAVHDMLAGQRAVWVGWSGRMSQRPLLRMRRDAAVRFVACDLAAADREAAFGYAADVLAPLLQGRRDEMAFAHRTLDGYLRVNAGFADLLSRLARRDDLLWIHDYALLPLPRLLRAAGLTQPIGFFLHAPVPPPQMLLSLPAHRAVFAPLADCDLIGVQTEDDATHLRAYFAQMAGGPAPAMPRIGVFPVGTDAAAIAAAAAAGHGASTALHDSLAGRRLILGVDRLDPSQGITQRLDAYGQLLDAHPAHRGRVVHLQITAPAAKAATGHEALERAMIQRIGGINGRHGDPSWTPVRYLARELPPAQLLACYRAARVALAMPLSDGMSLVAKDYVAAQDGADPGVLVLSRFAGAAAELGDGALLVNPFDTAQCTRAIRRALSMPASERRRRWRTMMRALLDNGPADWRERFLGALAAAPRQARIAAVAAARRSAAPY